MKATRCNWLMVFCILSIWSWSLMQFTLGLTVTKARKPRVASSRDMEPRMQIMCCETEVWGILATVIMQDGPFLALRLYILIMLPESLDHMMIFFTCKNSLVVLLQFYRLIVVFIEKPGHNPDSIIGRIQRYRHPGLRYHSNGSERGMTDSRNASTTKLLNIDGDATGGHLLPLLPTDNLTQDGLRLRHSVNMATPDEIYAHTPQLPQRFPQNDTAFVIGKTIPNDIPVQILPDELGVPESPTNSHSDYDNLQTPYGSVPNENGDAPFMVPDFPELASVYDSEEEAARRAEEAKMLENAEKGDEEDQNDTGKKGKKKKKKEDKKKEKEEKKKEEERKKEEKKKEKEEKKREEERKKEEKKKAKEDKRRESKNMKRESKKGGKKQDNENDTNDDQKEDDQVPASQKDNQSKFNEASSPNQSKVEDIKEEDDPPPSYTPPPSYSPPPSNARRLPSSEFPPPPPPSELPPPPASSNIPPPPPPPPKFPKSGSPSPPQSPPKSPPSSPVLVSFDDM